MCVILPKPNPIFLKLKLRRFCFKGLSLSFFSPFIYLTFFFSFLLFFPPLSLSLSLSHFLCFSSLSPVLLPGPSPDVCLLAVLLFKNILSMPLRASVR
uniref:Transmembrane protein n=1 Tax=Strix occidentalis caurina TaxID=311401 RepID=A0A8D0FY93_STROC